MTAILCQFEPVETPKKTKNCISNFLILSLFEFIVPII